VGFETAGTEDFAGETLQNTPTADWLQQQRREHCCYLFAVLTFVASWKEVISI
jgi:hypothetical protein